LTFQPPVGRALDLLGRPEPLHLAPEIEEGLARLPLRCEAGVVEAADVDAVILAVEPERAGTFQRLFKAATGVTPSHYQIDLRMSEARRLLRVTKMGVVDVALEVGYADPSHFARLFRRETGLSPSDYRRQR